MFAIYDSKELSRSDLFATRYNGICDINHWDFFFTLFFLSACTAITDQEGKRLILCEQASKEQKLASVTPFFNSIIATCCVDFNVLYCL